MFLTKCLDIRLQRVPLSGICTIDVTESLVGTFGKLSSDHTISLRTDNALRKIRLKIYKIQLIFAQGILDTCRLIIGLSSC